MNKDEQGRSTASLGVLFRLFAQHGSRVGPEACLGGLELAACENLDAAQCSQASQSFQSFQSFQRAVTQKKISERHDGEAHHQRRESCSANSAVVGPAEIESCMMHLMHPLSFLYSFIFHWSSLSSLYHSPQSDSWCELKQGH